MANSSCLGIYIEEHLIKYAKVSKTRDNIKVEAFGIKFYEKIGEAISQIVQETYSQNVQISINLSEEMYNYFEIFALLTKKDLQKVIKTEFETFCTEKGYNPNVFETRYAVTASTEDKEQIKIIHVAENKIELNKIMQQAEKYRLTGVFPISMTIPNLLSTEKNQNCIVVNIENKTTITTVLDNQIYNIEKLEEGSNDFLTRINVRENSYSKAYDICKNTTIYTSEGKNLQFQENEYLEEIMPTLFKISEHIKKTVNEYDGRIKKVYITGTAALINNIDLYFQENLNKVSCEILKPYFIENVGNVSIKDYIEVNSAISLAVAGVGESITGMNFRKKRLADMLPTWAIMDVGQTYKDTKTGKIDLRELFIWDLNQKLNKTEKKMIRIAAYISLLIIIYGTFSAMLTKQINNKTNEAQGAIDDIGKQIQKVNEDNQKINTKINKYTTLIKNVEDSNDKITDKNRTKNAIPNLLNQIMSIVPENVQLTSIDNTTDTHIVIEAKSNKYEQLGYLKAKIKTDVILTNVISTAGQKDNNVVTVKIEGDLP